MTLQEGESFRFPQRLDALRALRSAAKRYTRLPLSRRYVEDLLQKGGIRIGHENARYWWNRFGPVLAAKRSQKRGIGTYRRKKWRGHFDEVFADISGVTHCLRCAVDREREVLESVDATVRDRKAEQAWLEKPMKP